MVYEIKLKLHIGEYVITIRAENEEKLQEILRSIGFDDRDIVDIREVVI